MQKWEYGWFGRDLLERIMWNNQRINVKLSGVWDYPKIFNQLGQEGWELVCGDAMHGYMFKRPIKLPPIPNIGETK